MTEETRSILDRMRRYVEHETPSGVAGRVREFAERLAQDFQAAGARTELLDASGFGAHLRATVAGTEPDLDPVLVLGHLDTVWPVGTLEEMPFRVEDGRAAGPGTYDMKGSIAVLVEALERMRAAGERPRRPVEMLITCDEEVGSPTSQARIEEMARSAGLALVLEPPVPGGGAKTARKGVATYEIRVTGRAAHAGVEPEKGVSATAELAHQILRILELADPEKGTTLNVGVIEGGSATNVVAAEAMARVEARFTTAAEAERIAAALESPQPVLTGARVDIAAVENHRPPLERTAAVVELYEHARTCAADCGFELAEGASGGASDGCFTAAQGTATLDGLGIDGDGAHASHEHVLIDDLPRRLALYRRLLATV